jgi:hypothetical protein
MLRLPAPKSLKEYPTNSGNSSESIFTSAFRQSAPGGAMKMITKPAKSSPAFESRPSSFVLVLWSLFGSLARSVSPVEIIP